MPYVRRNSEGQIVAVFQEPEESAQEFAAADAPELAAFLGSSPGPAFSGLDADFIRVMEDLIDVLIEKGVLRLTDLPPEAQRKLLMRKDFRRKLKGALDLLGGPDVI